VCARWEEYRDDPRLDLDTDGVPVALHPPAEVLDAAGCAPAQPVRKIDLLWGSCARCGALGPHARANGPEVCVVLCGGCGELIWYPAEPETAGEGA